jgi:hypothetical protein
MVIADRFAWGHLPKAAGNTTLSLFQVFPEVIRYADPEDGHLKHTLFSERSAEVAGKELALNIRRLPSWMLSYWIFRSRHGIHPDYVPEPMSSPYAMSTSNVADAHLTPFIDSGGRRIEHWIRTEHLIDDFLAFISAFADLTPEKRARVASASKRNDQVYERELSHWFTSDHILAMYRANPLWRRVELEVYGDTVIDWLPLSSDTTVETP